MICKQKKCIVLPCTPSRSDIYRYYLHPSFFIWRFAINSLILMKTQALGSSAVFFGPTSQLAHIDDKKWRKYIKSQPFTQPAIIQSSTINIPIVDRDVMPRKEESPMKENGVFANTDDFAVPNIVHFIIADRGMYACNVVYCNILFCTKFCIHFLVVHPCYCLDVSLCYFIALLF